MNSKLNRFSFRSINIHYIDKYLILFNECFPKLRITNTYLEWLYFKNPNGQVIGMDAFVGNDLAAHYACIPIKLNGTSAMSLLSINTATHPLYQGKGLFKKLAEETYSFGFDSGFSSVIGVANQHSTKGFTRHLGFENLGNLNLRFGRSTRSNLCTREFTLEEINWLKNSPRTSFKFKRISPQIFEVKANIERPHIPIKTEIFLSNRDEVRNEGGLAFRVDWNLETNKSIHLPERFKPSPLTLIYRSLNETKSNKPHSWSFIDFDML